MRTFLRWTVRIVLSLLGLICLGLGVVYIVSGSKLDKEFDTASESVPVPSDAASIAEGKYLATAIGKCVHCHGGDFGGKAFVEEPILATMAGSNLTGGEGSATKAFTTEDWVRAIRFGVKKDGHGIPIMPSEEYWHFSDDELGKLIAYIKSLPPVDRPAPEQSYGPMGRVLFVAGALPLFPTEKIDRSAKRAPAPPKGPTAARGRYLALTGGCHGCHGADLKGGVSFGDPSWPLPANLTMHEDGLGGRSEKDFFAALKTGLRKDGGQMDPTHMPWDMTALMTDDDIRALWAYIQTVPPAASDWKE